MFSDKSNIHITRFKSFWNDIPNFETYSARIVPNARIDVSILVDPGEQEMRSSFSKFRYVIGQLTASSNSKSEDTKNFDSIGFTIINKIMRITRDINFGNEDPLADDYGPVFLTFSFDVPLSMTKLSTGGQSWLLGSLPDRQPFRTGTFAQSFPDLNEKAVGLEKLPLSELMDYLVKQRGRGSGEKIELFGAKIPTEVVALWGLPLIIIVQLYFFIYLRQLSGIDLHSLHASHAPWMGIFSDPFAQVLFFASISALPMFTAGYFVYSEATNDRLGVSLLGASLTNDPFILVFAGIAIVVSLLVVIQMWQLRTRK